MKTYIQLPKTQDEDWLKEVILHKISSTFSERKTRFPNEMISVRLEEIQGIFCWFLSYQNKDFRLSFLSKGHHPTNSGLEGIRNLKKLFHDALKKEKRLQLCS